MDRRTFAQTIWWETDVPVFLEKVILPVLATAIGVFVLLNPMKFDWESRIASAVGLLAFGFLISHQLHLRSEAIKPSNLSSGAVSDTKPAEQGRSRTVVSIGLLPQLSEDNPHAPVTGAALAFQNNDVAIDRNIILKLQTPSVITEMKIEHPDRIKITDGGKGGTYVNIFLPELLPGELQPMFITFAWSTPYIDTDSFVKNELKSPKLWSESHGESDVVVYRTKIGPVHKITPQHL